MSHELEKLLPYADARQREVVEAVIEAGSYNKAAPLLGINRSNVARRVAVLKRKVARSGYSEVDGLTRPSIYATSTLRKGGEDDDFQLQWTKAKTTIEQRIDRMLEIVEGFEYKPAPVVRRADKPAQSALATLYTITDFHLGMYAWSTESGEDWDTDIASSVMVAAIDEMVEGSPDSELGILNIQGDFLHFDSLDAVTPSSGHILDADTRHDKMIELAIDLNIWAIERLLRKHKRVKVIVCEGNHDMAGSAWLRKCLKKIMAKNKRVEVDDTSFPFYAMLHGKVMLAFHHGHKVKNASLPALFSSEPRYREMWGQAKCTYIHTGHYHHTEKSGDEFGGAQVERHPTLAARDAYAARGGYVSMRNAHAITYHKEHGEISRKTVAPIN